MRTTWVLAGGRDDAPILDYKRIKAVMVVEAVDGVDVEDKEDDASPIDEIVSYLDRLARPTRLKIQLTKYKDFRTQFRPK